MLEQYFINLWDKTLNAPYLVGKEKHVKFFNTRKPAAPSPAGHPTLPALTEQRPEEKR